MAVVRYLVNSVDKVLPFYRAVGFKLTDRWGPPFAIVKRRRLAVRLSGLGASARQALKDGSTPTPAGWNRLFFEFTNIEATLVDLAALGAECRSKPTNGLGGRQVLIEDPSGNPIELCEPRVFDE